MDDGETASQNQPGAGRSGAAIPENSPAPAPGTSRATEAALASIVEVRQPIRPEFTRGGLVALIPSFVIAFLMIMLAVGAVAMVSGLLGGANPFERSSPFAPSLPGFPNPGR